MVRVRRPVMACWCITALVSCRKEGQLFAGGEEIDRAEEIGFRSSAPHWKPDAGVRGLCLRELQLFQPIGDCSPTAICISWVQIPNPKITFSVPLHVQRAPKKMGRSAISFAFYNNYSCSLSFFFCLCNCIQDWTPATLVVRQAGGQGWTEEAQSWSWRDKGGLQIAFCEK